MFTAGLEMLDDPEFVDMPSAYVAAWGRHSPGDACDQAQTDARGR